MRRFALFASLAAAAALALAGCGQTSQAAGPIRLLDDTGKQLTLQRPVTRIVSNLLSEPAPAVVLGVQELARDLHPGHRIP